jgi:hypothetical protein
MQFVDVPSSSRPHVSHTGYEDAGSGPARRSLTSDTAPARELSAEAVAESGHLVALQRKVVDILSAFTPLDKIQMQSKPGAITYEDAATVRRDVERALAAVGISIVVGIKSGTRGSATRHACHLSPLGFTVSVGENTVTNRSARGSGVTCSRACEQVMLALSGLPLANGVCAFTGFLSFSEDEDGNQTSVLSFDTALSITLPAAYLKEATP